MIHTGSGFQLAASDLGRFLSCRRCTALDMGVAQGLRRKPPVYPDPFLDLLRQRGDEHEKKYVESIASAGEDVLSLRDLPHSEAAARCLSAMRQGRPAIAQGVLIVDEWLGIPDVLRRVERPSAFGPWSYEVHDTKLARETRGATILQLSLYSALLSAVQGVEPEWFHVVTPLGPESHRVSDFAAFYRLLKRRLKDDVRQDAATFADSLYPEPVEACEMCRWFSQCDAQRRGDDHLSLVAGISRLQRHELEARGITTLERLGELPLPLSFRPERGSKESLLRVQAQARVQLAGRRRGAPFHELILPVEEGRGLARLPEPDAGDLFLDLEGDHFAAEGPREYLFGLTAPGGAPPHRSLWAFGDSEEKAAFEAVVDAIVEAWERQPGMHVYHYAPYEPTAMKRLMGRYATREKQVHRMLRAGLFVDLCGVVKQALRASVESYSIKDLEPFFAFARKAPLREAGGARRVIEFALGTHDFAAVTPEVRALVEDYNREDCLSALALRDWLERLRADLVEAGTPVPRPPVRDGAASEGVEKRSAEVLAAMTALLDGVPPDREARTEPAQQARWLLAHMLEFHRREDNVAWWEFYRLCDISDADDRLAERAIVSGQTFVKNIPPVGKGRIPTHVYAFPSQEIEVGEGDHVHTQDEAAFGEVTYFDPKARRIHIKKAGARLSEHPSVVFVHDRAPIEPLPSSLLRLAADVITHGIEAPRHRGAARELLLANPPRLKKGKFEHLSGEDAVDFARRVVVQLDRSVLPIQGPPGAGKTFTGARMIVECVKKGLKVGVSAVSHKVIRNLLEKAVEAGREEHVPVRCLQKVKAKGGDSVGVTETDDNAEALGAFESGEANVVAGTAWLWARAEAADLLDVLFVDEAGQASLANVLAMAQAAKSIVLLGDPQQLEQPQRGTHPEGVDASALEHLLPEGQKTLPEDRGIFLDRTWRLPPAICKFTSELFYEGRLESRQGLERQVLSGAPPFEGAGLWFVPVEHDGNTNSSPEEVSAVAAIVEKLLAKGSTWTNDKGEKARVTAETDILAVAPFNAQVDLLEAQLGTRGVRVGTVDRFQGQEAAVVIYSMATSRPEDAPRGMEFLYDLNRLNVATSRARCACILVASPRLFEPDCKTPRQMKLANAMCRFLEQTRVSPRYSASRLFGTCDPVDVPGHVARGESR